MYNQMLVSFPFMQYANKLQEIETSFNALKQFLFNNHFNIPHPQFASAELDGTSQAFLYKEFPLLCDIFSTPNNLYQTLVIINYHYGNMIRLSEMFKVEVYKQDTFTVSITMEELLLIDIFKKYSLDSTKSLSKEM